MEDPDFKVLSDIISSIEQDAEIREVAFGLRFNLVLSRYAGLASTLGEPFIGKIKEKSCKRLAELAFSKNIKEASIGISAINSLINGDVSRCAEINASKIIYKLSEKKNVSVIGHFPFVDEIKKVAKNVWVIEKRMKEGDYPAHEKDHFVPLSDVVVITGTTLINHTFSSILLLCKKDALKILLGPSTPLSEVLFEYGIDILSGSVVLREVEIIESVRVGETFRKMKRKGGISLVTISKDKTFIS